jgi:hypothetical protein
MTRPSPAAPRLARLALVLGTILLGAYFVYWAVDNADYTYDVIRFDYEYREAPLLPKTDFGTFYAGARAMARGERDLYDLGPMVVNVLLVRGYDPAKLPDTNPQNADNIWIRYYNPPFFLLALSPLTLFELHTSYLIAVGLNLATLAGLAVALGFVLRWRQPETLLLILALLAFSPTSFALHHVQPTILLSLLLATAYLALRNGRTLLAALLFTLMALKPQWIAAGVASLRTHPRLIPPMFVFGLAIVVLPLAMLGPGAFEDYVRLVLGRGDDDLNEINFAGALLSWSGFFRALTGETRPDLWFLASVLTVSVLVVLIWAGGTELAIAGSVLSVLIVVPHSHPQEWVLIAPVAAILLTLDWRPAARIGVAAMLLGIFLAVNDWPAAQRRMDANGEAVFWATLAAFALLVLLTALALLRLDPTVEREEPEPSGTVEALPSS